ncbi:MAG: flagellar basal-body MS-ring/collar protein FliF [Armatimonadia bacterium]
MPQPTFVTQLTSLWQRLDRRARLVIIAAAALCVGGLIALTRVGSGTTYTTLYSNLSAEDAGQITEKLKSERTEYRLTDGGATIQVPTDTVYELRLSLAKEGLPTSGQVGFEIFDKSGLPGTQFNNRVNYQRALQGELARTIGSMGEIRSARVHLVLPEENLFSEKTKASASVVLQPKSGAEVTAEMTAAIAHIVASAVEEITPEQVTIVDAGGRVLRGPEDGKFGGLTASQFEIQRQYEDRLCLSLQSMLDSVLGPNQAVVRVQAQLDFNAEEVKDENIVPVADGKGLVTTEKVKEEQYQGSQRGGSGSMGLQPNVGVAGAGSGPGPEGGAYVQRDETRQYEFSRRTSSLVKAPGALKNLTVAAVIDENLTPSAEDQVKQVITAAAGLDVDRGDVVTVERMKIEAAELAKKQEQEYTAVEKGRRRDSFLHTALRSSLVLVAAALIFMSIMIAMRQVRGMDLGLAEPTTEIPPAEEEPASPPPALNEHARQQLRQMTRQDAGVVADRLRALLEGERN